MNHDTAVAGSNDDRFELRVAPITHREPTFAEEVERGLSGDRKSLPCRFFYDEAGSKIFEQICELPEYYLTRAERSILEERCQEICSLLPAPVTLVELGSGSAEKTQLLIETLLESQSTLEFAPIDISRHALEESADTLLENHPGLAVRAIEGEYASALQLLEPNPAGEQLILWLGSSVGNFEKAEAASFLAQVAESMNERDRLLIGIDLRKDRERLEDAYNDSEGVTERFNKNLLERINRELDADFDIEQFEFRAQYLDDSGSVESSLVSLVDQQVRIGELGTTFRFEESEAIHTEDSYKYSPDEIDSLARRCGMRCERRWLDKDGLFSLNLFAPD